MQNNKIKKIIISLIILIFISLGYYFLNKHFGFGIPCVFNKITGLYCPGCGITRMIFSIIQLDFYQAFRYNPLVFIYLILFFILIIIRIILKIPLNKELNKNIVIILLIITITFGILRNVPQFYYLIPTTI